MPHRRDWSLSVCAWPVLMDSRVPQRVAEHYSDSEFVSVAKFDVSSQQVPDKRVKTKQAPTGYSPGCHHPPPPATTAQSLVLCAVTSGCAPDCGSALQEYVRGLSL